jgi:hypothetical protein
MALSAVAAAAADKDAVNALLDGTFPVKENFDNSSVRARVELLRVMELHLKKDSPHIVNLETYTACNRISSDFGTGSAVTESSVLPAALDNNDYIDCSRADVDFIDQEKSNLRFVKWTIDLVSAKNCVIAELFNGVRANLEQFLQDEKVLLTTFRNYFNFHNIVKEVDFFQPCFTLFVDGMMESLGGWIESVNGLRKTKTDIFIKGMETPTTFSGCSDVALCMGHRISYGELKSPFNQRKGLFQTGTTEHSVCECIYYV